MLHIYKASAGSGKTFRLAKDYIKMLLGKKLEDGTWQLRRSGDNAHRAILAITFTNKATEEMKRRILHELARLGGCEPGWDNRSPYLKSLTEELHCTPAALGAAAAAALRDMVMDFNYFNVSTIDSFFQSVLRAFAREARVMGDYSVNVDDTEILTQGVGDMLARLNRSDSRAGEDATNARVTRWILDYLHSRMDQAKGVDIFNRMSAVRSELVRFVVKISDETFMSHFDGLMDYLRREDAPLERYRAALTEARETLSARLLSIIDNYTPPPKTTAYFAKAVQGFRDEAKIPTIYAGATFPAVLADPSRSVNKNAPDGSAELNGKVAAALDSIARRLISIRLILDSLYFLGLVERVYHCIDELHKADNSIQLSDTSALLRAVLGDDDAPFVYEKMGLYLDHLLIDEFQDTSLMQWTNLRPLVGETHSRDNDNLIIGDVKQCIYRFRNSDPSLLRDKVEREFDRVVLSGTTVADNTNWRSSADMVRFNNTLFSRMAVSEANRHIYSNVVQQISPKHLHHPGHIRVKVLDTPGTAEEMKAEALRVMLADIHRQLGAGYRPSDICVLTRSNSDARLVIDTLLADARSDNPHPYSVISDDALCVTASPVVRSVITNLRFLGAADVKSRERLLTPRKFTRLFNAFDQTMASRWGEIQAGEGDDPSLLAGDILREVITNALPEEEEADTPVPGDRTDTVLATDLTVIIERILATLPGEKRAEQAMYVTALMDAVADYVDRGDNDIRSFLKWWDEYGCKVRVSSPENDNAIRVMTLHKAKGLEFRCVHIPIGSWDMKKLSGAKWFVPLVIEGVDPALQPPLIPLEAGSRMMGWSIFADQQQALADATELDELNALYVALTRPVDELSICLPEKPSKDSTGALMLGALQAMLREPPSELFTPVIFDSEQSLYYIGSPTIPWHGEAQDGADHTPPKALDPTATPPMPEYFVADRSDLWADTSLDLPTGFEGPRSRGTLIHAALASITHASDLERALTRMVMAGVLPRHEHAPLRRLLRRELGREEVRPWFEDTRRVLSERSLYVDPRGDGNPSERRPDRVVWTASGTIDVIDYKTGDLPPGTEGEAELRRRHSAQVKGYVRWIRGIFPDEPAMVRGFVWHLDSSTIVRIV